MAGSDDSLEPDPSGYSHVVRNSNSVLKSKLRGGTAGTHEEREGRQGVNAGFKGGCQSKLGGGN